MKKKTQTEGAIEKALNEYKAACAAVKQRKDTAFAEFQRLDKIRNHGGGGMALPEIDPFDTEAARAAAETTGSPVEMKNWVALARGLSASVFRDSEFAAATLRVIQAVAKPAIEKDQQLMAEVAQAEARLMAEKARLEEEVRQAHERLCAHRRMVTDGIIKPALGADTYRLDNLPGAFTGWKGNCHMGIRFGVEAPVQAQLNSLLNQMVQDTKKPTDGDPYAHLAVKRGEYVPDAAMTDERMRLLFPPLPSVAGPDGYGETRLPPIRTVLDKMR